MTRVVGADEFQARRQIGHQLHLLGGGRAGIGKRYLIHRLALQITALGAFHGNVQFWGNHLNIEAFLGLQIAVGPGGQ